MATSHLMTGKHIPHFDLNSLIYTLSFDESFSYFATLWKYIAQHFESVKAAQMAFPIFCNLSCF